MDPYNHTTPTSTKLPILDTGKFEQWKFRIQQYLQHEHYALWEVIEFGDSYKAPPEETGKGLAGEGSAKKKGRTVAITAEDMQKQKNDVKARTTLLLALPDEHQLRFSKYDTAKELWEAILKTFGGNEATKKTKKNQLKQQYGNFKAEGSETLEQTFNRLQAIVSHLEFMDVPIEQDDLNQKFLTSLAPEWLVYTIVWRNMDDLDTMSLDDVYNHLKVYKHEVQNRAGSNSQNMAFISSSNTSNEVPTVQGFSTASGQVSTANTDIAVASLSYDTVCAFIATQPNGSQIKYKDISQIDDDDIEEMDIKWNLALLSMRADRFWKKTGKKITIQGSDVAGFDKSKVECFNCHKMGHFARECKSPRSQDKGKRESYKRDPKVEEPASK
ncbi:ribonuclease H-like domain-containing protein, partial [Tanacetum coccineum]